MDNEIKSQIHTIRGVQVMLDSDLAILYHVQTKQLNKAVNRNIARFPDRYRFQLSEDEFKNLRFQNDTSSHGGRRYLPYVFTEQGISMLSAVLRSEIAVEVSIKIIDSFVEIRRFLSQNAAIFTRLENIEEKLFKHDENFHKLFDSIEQKQLKPTQGIFYDGEVFDAYNFVANLIRDAKKSIVLVDNFVDDSVLTLLSKNQNITVSIYTQTLSKQLKLDLEKYNKQYNAISVKIFKNSHDRFMIIDEDEVYHIGASLKDLGKKWFAFSKMDNESFEMIGRLYK